MGKIIASKCKELMKSVFPNNADIRLNFMNKNKLH